MRTRSVLAVSVLLVCVLLAGCSALLDDGNGDGASVGGTADPTPDASTFDYADGFGPDGVVDGSAAVESHQSGLIARGSYATAYNYTLDTAEGTTVLDVEGRVDFDDTRVGQQVVFDRPNANGTVEIYRTDDTLYRRVETENDTSFRRRGQAFNAENLTALDPIRPLLLNISGYEASVGDRDGATVVIYEKDSSEGVDSFYGVRDSANITSFSGRFAVDADGVVRSASYELGYVVDGEERTLTVEYTVSAIGETSVSEPDWTDRA